MDGNKALVENAADNGGVAVSYLAYRQWMIDNNDVTEDRLPGLERFSPQQMFWLNYAQGWCSMRKYRMYNELIIILKGEMFCIYFRRNFNWKICTAIITSYCTAIK